MLISLVLSEQNKTKQKNKKKKQKQEKKKCLSALRVEALLPTVEAYPHTASSPALNRCCLCSSCHFCCHNFVWSLIALFLSLFSLWSDFSFSLQKPKVVYVKASSAWWQPQSCNKLSFCKFQEWYSLTAFIREPVCMLHTYLYLYFQSSFCTSVCSILHTTPVSDSSGYSPESVWDRKRICKDIMYSLRCKVNQEQAWWMS